MPASPWRSSPGGSARRLQPESALGRRTSHPRRPGRRPCPASPSPTPLLLILDCTNLGRHLVLAAPILSLKLPTLVILNMADDLKSRGGHVDTAELASELGSPVALISAAKGQGVEKVFQFMEGTSAGTTSLAPPRVELPVLQDIPRCRQWAHDIGTGAAYRAPAPPIWTRRLDAVFLHPSPAR